MAEAAEESTILDQLFKDRRPKETPLWVSRIEGMPPHVRGEILAVLGDVIPMINVTTANEKKRSMHGVSKDETWAAIDELATQEKQPFDLSDISEKLLRGEYHPPGTRVTSTVDGKKQPIYCLPLSWTTGLESFPMPPVDQRQRGVLDAITIGPSLELINTRKPADTYLTTWQLPVTISTVFDVGYTWPRDNS